MVGAAQGRSGSGFQLQVDASRSSESGGGCRPEVSLVTVNLFLVSLFPRVKAPQVIHTTLLSLGHGLGPAPFVAVGVTRQEAVSSLVASTSLATSS